MTSIIRLAEVDHMLRTARFALIVGLSAGIPVIFALDPPKPQNKQSRTKQEQKSEKKIEPAKKDDASKGESMDEKLDRRNTRMKERNREIDGLVNKPRN